MDCICCGAPAEFFSMCRSCMNVWAEIKTKNWLIQSRQQLERMMAKQSKEKEMAA